MGNYEAILADFGEKKIKDFFSDTWKMGNLG